MFNFFSKKRFPGKTVRNDYLDNHGYYISMEKHLPLQNDGHSAPMIPYAIVDILQAQLEKSTAVFVRWNVCTYRWALHSFEYASSSRVKLEKNPHTGHRRFIRNDEKTAEELQSYTDKHLKKFDVIVFDGPDKAEEFPLVLPVLKDNGIVIMVNDANDDYDFDQALMLFRQQGFKTLLITNPAPGVDSLTAAVIYDSNNILDL